MSGKHEGGTSGMRTGFCSGQDWSGKRSCQTSMHPGLYSATSLPPLPHLPLPHSPPAASQLHLQKHTWSPSFLMLPASFLSSVPGQQAWRVMLGIWLLPAVTESQCRGCTGQVTPRLRPLEASPACIPWLHSSPPCLHKGAV